MENKGIYTQAVTCTYYCMVSIVDFTGGPFQYLETVIVHFGLLSSHPFIIEKNTAMYYIL